MKERIDLLQGTLDLLILRVVREGPVHGQAIAGRIERDSGDEFRIEHGSLYPALHRMERNGWLEARWEDDPVWKRPVKKYRLTAAGRKQMRRGESKWSRLVEAMARIANPAAGGAR